LSARESSTGVPVLDQGCNTVQAVDIEDGGPCGQDCRQCAATFGAERELPDLGAFWLLPSMEEGVAVLCKDRDCLSFKDDTTVVVAQQPNSHQAVVEAGHDVAGDK
jgi:hypothetical protein